MVCEIVKKTLKCNIPFSIFMLIAIAFTLYYQGGFYDPTLDLIKCYSKESCLHEATHQYDYQHGLISKSIEWKNTVDLYQIHALDGYTRIEDIPVETMFMTKFPGLGRNRLKSYNPFRTSFWEGGWGGYTEYYASVVNYCDGDIEKIPESLRQYYDMYEINETMKGLGY